MRFAGKERIDEARLCNAADRASRGQIDADLIGGLIKQRIARPGRSRSGGYRTLMAFRSKHRTVFVYGFAKNERENINQDELEFWRRVARGFLHMDEAPLDKATMRDIDAFCLTKVEPPTGAEIQALHEREGVSQAVLARSQRRHQARQ